MTTILLSVAEITLSMSAVILLLLSVLRLFGGRFTARCRYILWCVVLVRLAIPVGAVFLPTLVEVPLPAAAVTVEPADAEPRETKNTETEITPGTAAPPLTTAEAAPVEPIPAETALAAPEISFSPAETTASSVSTETTAEPQSVPLPPAAEPTKEHPILIAAETLRILAAVYIAGAVLYWGGNMIAYAAYTRTIRRDARPAEGRIRAVYGEICRAQKIRRMPRLLISPKVQSPAAFGWFCRCIVLPDVPLSGDALAGMLLHEVTHCCRGDLWVKLLALFVRGLHWMNPLSHLAARRCEEEMELSCDEAVLAGCGEDARIRYGEVMLDIVRRCRGGSGTLTTHFHPKKNAVKHRIRNIRYGSGKSRGAVLIALCLAVCLLAGTIVSCRNTDGAVSADDTADISDTEDTSAADDTADETTAALSVDFDLPKEFREIPMVWNTAEYYGQPAEVRELSPEEITGFADERYADAAPVTVDGKTVFVFTTTTGYAAAWTEGEYKSGEMPEGAIWCFEEIDTAADSDPAFMRLSPCREALSGKGFTFSYGWVSASGWYYFFNESGELCLLDSMRGLHPYEADVDGDGAVELVVVSESYVNVTVWDLVDGVYWYADMIYIIDQEMPSGGYVTYRQEENDFKIGYYKNGEPGTFYRQARIVGDTLYVWDQPDEWKQLAQDAGGNVFLFGQTNNTQSMQFTFRVSVNRSEVTLTLSDAAWVSGTWAPEAYFADVTGDGTYDAVVIFTTGTGTGIHVEELIVVDGVSGTVYELPAPGEAVESRVTVTQSGNKAIAADDGTLTAICDDSYFDKHFSFLVSEDGTITAEVAVGYNIFQYMDDPYIVEYTFTDGAFAVSTVTRKAAAQDSGKLLVGTYTMPIHVYGSDTLTIGSAEVTLTYNEILHDPRYQYFADSIGPAYMKVIRCDDPDVTEQEIFNWFYSGYARVYNLKNTETYTTDMGYHYPTTRYFHGMNEQEIAAYGAEKDAEYRARREYMYMIEIDTNTWLCLDYLRDESAPVDKEEDYFNKTAARVEVPEIRYDSVKYAEYLLECVRKRLSAGTVTVGARTEENAYQDNCGAGEAQMYLDALQTEKWTAYDGAEAELDQSRFSLHVSGYYLCATKQEDVMSILVLSRIGDGIRVDYAVPAGTADTLVQLCVDKQQAEKAAYQTKLDAMDAFMPEEAVERLVRHRIFCSQDYILSFRTKDGSLSLWRAEEEGENYVRLELEIPEKYTYDYFEVVGAAGGGGSGEYNLLVALYDGDTVEYAIAYGWFREAPAITEEAAAWLTADWLMSIAGANGVFPNKTAPRAIDDLSEWDALGVQATTAYYGEEEDIRLAFLRAFLENDTARLEEICGVETGMYDSWKGMYFGDWVVYVQYNEMQKRDQVYISYILSYSESEAFPGAGYTQTLLVEESICGAEVTRGDYLYADTWHADVDAAQVLRTILRTVTAAELPTTDEMEEGVRWQITEYLCSLLGEGLYPAEEVTALAERIFGIENFTPDPLHVSYAGRRKTAEMGEGDYCSAVPHGGSTVSYYITACRTDGDTTAVTVQFYSDPSCTVKSHRVEYRFVKTGSEIAPYRVTYTVLERSEWEPFVLSV